MNSFGDVPLPSHVARVYLHVLPCKYTWMYSWTLTCEHLGWFLCGVSLGSTGVMTLGPVWMHVCDSVRGSPLAAEVECIVWIQQDSKAVIWVYIGPAHENLQMLRCCWAAVQNSWSTTLHGVVFLVSLFSLPGLFAVVCHSGYIWMSRVSTDVDLLHLPLGHWLLFGGGVSRSF